MEALNTILQIPERSLVAKKITKAFFKRNFVLTSGEKALLDDVNAITAIDWLASLSPGNSNISRFQDEQYLFEEVQVISVQTADLEYERNCPKIIDLVQKFIPYPILLCIWNTDAFVLNTCDKKINQNDGSRRTIDKKYVTEQIMRDEPTDRQQSFLNSIAFAELDKTNLKTYYEAYSQRIIALQAAEISGLFTPRTKDRTQTDMAMLEKIEILQSEIQQLQQQAKKETQLSQQVALNTRVQEKRKLIEQLKAMITA